MDLAPSFPPNVETLRCSGQKSRHPSGLIQSAQVKGPRLVNEEDHEDDGDRDIYRPMRSIIHIMCDRRAVNAQGFYTMQVRLARKAKRRQAAALHSQKLERFYRGLEEAIPRKIRTVSTRSRDS